MIRVSWLLMCKPLPGLEAEAAACEDAGLDGVWWMDYQGPSDPAKAPCPELTVTLPLLARATSRVFVGSLVTDVLKRHPMAVAHAFASLSHLAPGRLILGLGAGGGTSHLPFGISLEHAVSRLDEGIQAIRRLWQATPDQLAQYEGRFFQLRDAMLPIRPSQPVPIYLAAFGPRMLRLAGEQANGWVPEAHTPQTYKDALGIVESHRRRSGSPRGVEPCLALLFFPFEPDEDERRRLLRAAKVTLAYYPDLVRRLVPGLVPDNLRTHDLVTDPARYKQVQDAIPDGIAWQTVLVGSPDRCAARLHEYVDVGCRHFVLEPFWGLERGQIRQAIRLASAIRTRLQASA